MKLLIVDDEYLIIEDMVSITDWELIGIKEIFTAMNAARAKQLLAEKQIDIMFCDIEMPKTDGLELLRWTKENYPETEVIMLTCHAQFGYARTALQYGSFDYVLKPVMEDDIVKIVRKVSAKIETERVQRELQAGGKLWNEMKSTWEEHFWEDCLQGIWGSEDEIKKEAEKRHCEKELYKTFVPVLFHSYPNNPSETDMTGWKACVAEALQKCQCEYRLPVLSPQALAALCFIDIDHAESLREKLADIFQNSGIADRMGIYLGRFCAAGDVAEINKLRWMALNNVNSRHGIFLAEDWEPERSEICLPDMSSWRAWIDSGREKELSLKIAGWLRRNAETDSLSRNVLQMLQYDLEQVLYALLQESGIQAHQFLCSKADGDNRIVAVSSVENMAAWVDKILNDVADVLREIREPQTLVESVKKYIDSHLEEDLNRIKVADAVFMSSDYLDRRFKKETGCSVNRYILKKQLEMAKRLLLYPDISISQIATKCGYTNMSNFSAMFKRETGLSPNEYRKNSIDI